MTSNRITITVDGDANSVSCTFDDPDTLDVNSLRQMKTTRARLIADILAGQARKLVKKTDAELRRLALQSIRSPINKIEMQVLRDAYRKARETRGVREAIQATAMANGVDSRTLAMLLGFDASYGE